MSWELNSTQPIYLQVAEKIGQRIISGEYPPGGKLPPVRELAEEAGVNPNTMQRAMNELENEGLVYAQRTSGRFITEDTARIAKARREAAQRSVRKFLGEMSGLGLSENEISALVREAIGGTPPAVIEVRKDRGDVPAAVAEKEECI